MGNKKRKNTTSFLAQGTILAAASLISRVIGLIYRMPLTAIIGEYNGEETLPSTIESAIVHMVDGLLKKLEVLDEDTVGSNWNQDMVIYQTLNEYSAAGLYDRSGLSMNMFLKIREYLVNEEALLV